MMQKKKKPIQSFGRYSDSDIFIIRLYKYEIGRTLNGIFVDMNDNAIDDAILWAYIPNIPKRFKKLFDTHI